MSAIEQRSLRTSEHPGIKANNQNPKICSLSDKSQKMPCQLLNSIHLCQTIRSRNIEEDTSCLQTFRRPRHECPIQNTSAKCFVLQNYNSFVWNTLQLMLYNIFITVIYLFLIKIFNRVNRNNTLNLPSVIREMLFPAFIRCSDVGAVRVGVL